MRIFTIGFLIISLASVGLSQKENAKTSFGLVESIYHTPNESRLDSNNLSVYVNRFSKIYYAVLNNDKMKDSGYAYMYGSLRRIAQEYQFNPKVLAMLLKISDQMTSNAEFSESMPSFIQQTLIIQPEVFLSQLDTMDNNDQSSVIDLVTFTRTKKVKSVLQKYISDSTNVQFNKLAAKIIKYCE